MNKKLKQLIIGIFTIILIILMFIIVDVNNFLDNLYKISFPGIFLFILIYTGIFLARTYRLKMIFYGLRLKSSFVSLFSSFGIGWSLNEIIPGKMGDLARIEVINEKHDDINLSHSIYGVAIERFMDLLILFSFTFLTLLCLSLFNIRDSIILNLNFYLVIGAIIISGCIIFLILLFYKSNWILNPIGKISVKFKNNLEKFLKNFLKGINNFRKNKKLTFIVFISSILVWIFETFTILMIFYLTGVKINIFVIILAQIILFFSKTFPITPGGWFVSENIGSLFIILFYPHFQYNNILSLFILDHALRISYIFVFGIFSSLILNFRFKNLKINNLKKEKEMELTSY